MSKFKVGDLVQRNKTGLTYDCWHRACKYVGINPTDIVVVIEVTETGITVSDRNGKSLSGIGSYWMSMCFSSAVEVTIVECGDEDGL